jgi:STE24 endopeptidase
MSQDATSHEADTAADVEPSAEPVAEPSAPPVAAAPALRHSVHPPLGRRTPYRADDWFSAEQLAEARAYARPLNRLRLVRSLLSTVALVVVVFTKVAPRLLDRWGVHNWVLGLAVLVVLFTVGDLVLSVWLSGWQQLVYDKRWDLSTQTPGRFAVDQVKDVVLGSVLTTLLLLPVYAAIRATDRWWLWGWLGFMALILAVTFVYPVVIMPRFNKFTPLPDGDLRSRIEAVARLAATPLEGIYTMDASKRTKRGNAFVAGFGATTRVVLFDTILDDPVHTTEQIVAHEIGHYRLRHVLKSVPFQALLFLAAFVALAALGRWHTLLRGAGITRLGEPGSVPLFLLAFGLFWSGLNLAQAWFSRFKEREADLEALELLGRPSAFLDLWRRMAPKDKVELEPSWWARLNHTHPEVPERMAFARRWADANRMPVDLSPD